MQVGRLKYDVFFKKVFYKKHLMKAFLNTVLAPELHEPICDLSYEPTDCEPTQWTFDWEIIALYPRNIPPEHIEQHTIDALEEWLLLDIIEDVATAQKIQQLLHSQEVKEAFHDLDLSTLSEDQVRRLIFSVSHFVQVLREGRRRICRLVLS